MGRKYLTTLPELESRELFNKFMALFEDGKVSRICDAHHLEVEYGGYHFVLIEEAIDREIARIKRTHTGDESGLDALLSGLIHKKQRLTGLREPVVQKEIERERAAKSQSDRSVNWRDIKSTKAIGKNQKVDQDKEEHPHLEEVIIPKGPHYKTVDARIYDSFRRAPCHHNATALLLLLIIEQAYEGKKDTHHTWKYWRLKRGLVASSMSQSEMAKSLGVSIPSIKRYIKALVDNGDIKVEVQNRENVYILGEASPNGTKFDYFYYMRASEGNE